MTETDYTKTKIETLDELDAGDEVDVFHHSGYKEAVVTEALGHGLDKAVKLEVGVTEYMIQEHGNGTLALYKWDSGTEEDFMDWRHQGDIQNIELVEEAETDGGTDEIRGASEVRNARDDIRYYSADGTLYAYAEGGEHVVVSRGNDPATRWTKRVPAERTAVVTDEQLWTIPDNWEQRLSIKGADVSRYAVYRIPETGVDVLVTVPNKNHLVDAWYGVKAVGELEVSYADSCKWDRLSDAIAAASEYQDVADEAIEALETLYQRRNAFERKYAEGVDMYAEDTLFEGFSGDTVRLEGWTVDPWSDSFMSNSRLLADFLDIEGGVLKAVERELNNVNVIPSYPNVKVDVADREGLPEGYDMRALTQAGCTPPEALDYLMVEMQGLTQSGWADERGVSQPSVSNNVKQAKRKLTA